MRLDKFLKVSRIIKRRTIAKEAAIKERVLVNGKLAKPSTIIKINDEITLSLGLRTTIIKVTSLTSNKDTLMYELLKSE